MVSADVLNAAREQFVDMVMTLTTVFCCMILVSVLGCIFVSMLERNPIVDFEDNMDLENANRRLRQVEVQNQINVHRLLHQRQIRNYIEHRYDIIEIAPNHLHLQNREKSPKRSTIKGTDKETEDPGRTCVICATNEKQCAALPCGHVIYCIDCANKRKETKCPMCRKKMKNVIRIFT